ncbi:MAG: calcium-binding protein [Nostoc sp. DedQUE11]|nr:calcium-binding protein [Nostoc sp. DedQUE11]
MANIKGTNGDDTLNGTICNDLIQGLAGNDVLSGKGGKDTLDGGSGDDTLNSSSSAGNNRLKGGSEDDYLNISHSSGKNTLEGGSDNDTLNGSYSFGNNVLSGDTGNDSLEINYSNGNNTLSGGTGRDSFYAYGVLGKNTLNGGDGNDSFYFSTSNSVPPSLKTQTVDGGTGNDLLSGDYRYATAKITSTFDRTTNTGSIKVGTHQVSYKNIEGLNITGTAYDDNIVGSNGNDTLFVSGYYNFLNSYTATGNDTLKAGVGNDRLYADSSEDNNLLDGGDGNDTLSASSEVEYFDDPRAPGFVQIRLYSSGNNTLKGGNGNDWLSVNYSKGDNLLDGGDGNDLLSASGVEYGAYVFTTGNNTLNGGAGNDRLSATYSTGNNLLNGGDGNDSVSLSGGQNTVDGGIGDDLLTVSYYSASQGITSSFNATTNIGSITAGTQQVSYKNIERLNIFDTAYNDKIVGSNGNDMLSTSSGGSDTIDGGIGDDVLTVNYFFSSVGEGITSTFNTTTNTGSITAGTQQVSYKNIERLNIFDTAYNDKIVGSNGNDMLSTSSGGSDTIDGAIGDDVLIVDYSFSFFGEGITSSFNATTNIGSVTIGTQQVSYKNIERLIILGTLYDDNIVGSNGNDTISGRNGSDTLYGGNGIDTFGFNSFDQGVDTIYDFNATNELIQLPLSSIYNFTEQGLLSASKFTIGASATTSTQRIIYNSTTGALFFDQDGSAGAFIQVQFAQLSAGLSLTNNNFVVV